MWYRSTAPFLKASFCCLSLAPHQDTQRSWCVCGTVRGDSWRFLPSVTERLWLPECDQPLVCLLLHPCSLACPATLLVARSPLSIYTAYGSGQLETCSVQLGAAASWASPSFLHTSSPFLSDGRGPFSRSCPQPCQRWRTHHPWLWVWSDSSHTPHTHAVASAHTGPDGRTGGRLPRQTPCSISGLASRRRKIRLRLVTYSSEGLQN